MFRFGLSILMKLISAAFTKAAFLLLILIDG
jgi:hypothetical protein